MMLPTEGAVAGAAWVSFRVQNTWPGMTSAGFRIVLAGRPIGTATVEDEPGALRVFSMPTDERGAQAGRLTRVGDFTPLEEHGALHMTRVEDDTLYLTAEDGTALPFDMLTLEFGGS